MRLVLLPSPGDYEGDRVYNGIITVLRRLENAGREFFYRFERSKIDSTSNSSAKPASRSSSCENENPASADAKEDEKWSAKHRHDRKNKTSGGGGGGGGATGTLTRLKKLIEGPNLYKVLGVSETSSSESIKKSYRKLALEYHPDKRRNKFRQHEENVIDKKNVKESEDEATKRFLLLQDAYEVLSDQTTRWQYDSALPFDETIPSASDVDVTNPQSFYNVFAPVFKRNARWSVKRPVPILDPKAGVKDVHKFYTFWWNFDSSRDFSIRDEYDVATAECREERRWMERQNQKSRKKDLQEEKSRISKLVELAQSLDPIIKAQKEQEKMRKESIKNARRLEKEAEAEQKKAEEQRKQESVLAEKRAVEEIQRLEVEARQKVKAALRKLRQRFREICAPSVIARLLTLDDVQVLALETPGTELEKFVNNLEPVAKDIKVVAAQCQQRLDLMKTVQEENAPSIEQSKPSGPIKVVKKTATQVEWTAEEMQMLVKGIQRYPGGTSRRWQMIAGMIGSKTVEQVIEKTKEMADGSSLKSLGSNKSAIDNFMRTHGGCLKPVGAPPDIRDGVADEEQPDVVALSKPENITVAPSAASPVVEWSDEQQKKLEKALQVHSSSLPPKDRWLKISADVPGKTAKECLGRFKEIRQAILSSAAERQNPK